MEQIIEYILCIPAALLSLSIHECAHGYMACRLGDPTARNLGRLSLNPLRHLDPIGVLCMILLHFGWAKPVPVNARYFKNPRRDMALTAAAGPLSNLLLAILSAPLVRLTQLVGNTILPSQPDNLVLFYFFTYLASLFYYFHLLNLSLCVFNLIPLPPLDGSRIFLVFLPEKLYFGIMKYERIIQIVLLIVLWLGFFTGVIGNITNFLSSLIFRIFSFIPTSIA